MDYKSKLAQLMVCKMKGITMSEMAIHLGVSVSWVSQHYSNKANLSKQSQEKLEQFIENYQAK